MVDHSIDRQRIFITGLSSGGAMTSVMLATYPEVFAGGAVIAGLPYVGGSSLMRALHIMKGYEETLTSSLTHWCVAPPETSMNGRKSPSGMAVTIARLIRPMPMQLSDNGKYCTVPTTLRRVLTR